jgi:hypothetical protein
MAQEINAKNAVAPLEGGMVRPNEMTTVYSTDLDKFHTTGSALEVHVNIADKLVEAGKATREAPAKGPKAKKGGEEA